jgi:hypothetical protein
MAIRDTHAFDGLGRDQCRKRHRIVGANTFRLVMTAARTLGFLDQVERGTTFNLGSYRPWYRQKIAPSQLDVVWACREALHEAGQDELPPAQSVIQPPQERLTQATDERANGGSE